MPPEEDLEYEVILKKGLEASAVAFGTAFGTVLGGAVAGVVVALIIEGVFPNRSEPDFEQMLRNIQEIVRVEIEDAFVKDHAGKLLAYGSRFKDYLRTLDSNDLARNKESSSYSYLMGIQDNVQAEFGPILGFKASPLSITALAYGMNLSLLVYRAMADYDWENYSIAQEKALTYADQYQRHMLSFTNPIRTSISPDTSVRAEPLSGTTLCSIPAQPGEFPNDGHSAVGREYLVTAEYHDYKDIIGGTAKMCFPFPVIPGGLTPQYDENWKPTLDDLIKTDIFKIYHNRRGREYNKRILAVARFEETPNLVISRWRQLSIDIAENLRRPN